MATRTAVEQEFTASLEVGRAIPGPAGPMGPAGPQGETGPAGADGADGADGTPKDIADEGTLLTRRDTLNFTGAGVTATDDGTRINVTIPGASGGHIIAEEGSALTARPTLNFIGSGVTAADDSANNRTNVTIAGSSGGIAYGLWADRAALANSDGKAALFSDSPYQAVNVSGSLKYFYQGMEVIPPPALAGWTLQNFTAGSAATEEGGTIVLRRSPQATNDVFACLTRALGTGSNFECEAGFDLLLPKGVESNSDAGFALRDGATGKLVAYRNFHDGMIYLSLLNGADNQHLSHYVSTIQCYTMRLPGPQVFLRFKDDGTNRLWQIGTSPRDYETFFVQGRTTGLTHTHACLYVSCTGTTPPEPRTRLRLFHYRDVPA